MFEVFMTEEQKRLRDEVRDFVKSVPRQLLLDMDADKVRYPREFLVEAGRRNLLGLRFPPKYGGRGLKWVDEMIALEEIGTLGVSLSCLYSLVSIVGEALNVFGTEAQKEKYLRPTVEGKLYCAEALTEPRGGSDFFGSTTVARKEGGHYVLNGQKRFIVGAEGADYFLAYAVTDPTAPAYNALSAFIVERDMGVEVKYIYGLMGTRGGGTGRILLRDVRVPEKNLLGEENGGGKIFYQMMIPERIVSGPTGSARAMLEIAARYADKRKAFGQKIRNFQAVSFKIAEGITKLDAVSALAYAVAKSVDEGIGTSGYRRRLVSELKRFSTQVQWDVINDAMQILGGIGYTSVFPVERALRDARLPMIWTGTNEVMDLIIQHEYYNELLTKEVEGRDVEADIALTESEATEEKVYE
ncbi:MAG: acyl-CoA/acyl-ACP dehydrogenase [Dehalococcoidia bacterium]|jgi:alkylation response protein AidB-like acyl-CoA dehydrogenase|nr:acyl-CoA/acyl-ACP dehydrogenase [Chloroflexota bacterium]MCK4243089.1 acyl-CoA/acyl-ACP dehydrogenase [Dehalococcoidia bacterium]